MSHCQIAATEVEERGHTANKCQRLWQHRSCNSQVYEGYQKSSPVPNDTIASMGTSGHRRRASCTANIAGLLAVVAPS